MLIFNSKLVEKERRKRNLSQAKFAEMLGITPSFYSYLKKNKRLPSVSVIEKIYFELQLPLGKILIEKQ